MFYQIFFSPQVKRSAIISNSNIRVASRVSERLKTYDLRKLGKIRKISKLHRIKKPGAQSSSQSRNFVDTSKRLLKNRN